MQIPILDMFNTLTKLLRDLLTAAKTEQGTAEIRCIYCDGLLPDNEPTTYLDHTILCPKGPAQYLSPRARKATVARLKKIVTTYPDGGTDAKS